MNGTEKNSCVVLLSGGLDSALALALAAGRMDVRLALFADYGQKAAGAEERAAAALSNHYGVKFRKVSLPWLSSLGSSALTSGAEQIPVFDRTRFSDLGYQNDTARAVWVPNRNGLLFNVAACFAEALGCGFVAAGLNAEEGATFKDNTPGFVKAVSAAFAWSTANDVAVLDMISAMNKEDIVRRGLEIGLPFELVHSCYYSRPAMCGACESCARSVRAYKAAGIWGRMRSRFESDPA